MIEQNNLGFNLYVALQSTVMCVVTNFRESDLLERNAIERRYRIIDKVTLIYKLRKYTVEYSYI